MATTRQRGELDDSNRRRLAELGLSTQQIQGLDIVIEGMRAGRRFESGPTMRQTKLPLELISERTREVLAELTPVLDAANSGNGEIAARDAGNRLFAAASIDGAASTDVEVIAAAMASLQRWCDQALSEMPIQARSSTASIVPIGRIWDVLQRHRAPQAPTIAASISKGPLREICGICYQAASGQTDVDPERALRAFIKAYNERQQRTKASASAVTVVTERKIGRQVRDLDDLPS